MLVIVRHGESEGNAANAVRGQQDYMLTEKGIHQCHQVGFDLIPYKFDRIISSPLKRAYATAVIIRNNQQVAEKVPVEVYDALKERSGGDLEGMTYDQVKAILPPKKYRLWQRDYMEAPPGGESMADVEERLKPFCQEVLYPAMDVPQTILLSAHSTVIKVLIGMIRGSEPDEVIKMNVEHCIPYFWNGKSPLWRPEIN